MEAPERITKALFELNVNEFVSSLIGITNGKEGLALTADFSLQDDEVGQQDGGEKEEKKGAAADSKQRDEEQEEGTGLTCRTCAISFEGVEDQRDHFRLDWHRCNVKRKLEKKASISEADFEKMLDEAEVSSISGSDSEASDGDGPDTTFKGQSHFVEFQTSNGMFATICKTLLMQNPRENVTVEEVRVRVPEVFNGKIWSYFMCSGGHFAGVVFNGDKVLAHKTIHKYTVRRKQGGSQLAQDSTGKKAKSAGATIRRHNEFALQQEIRALLVEWATYLKDSKYIFIQAPSFNRQIFFGYEETPFKKGDDRLRKIPFTTRRPTFAEVKRLHSLLSTVTFSRESIYQKIIEEAQINHLRKEKEMEKQKEKEKQKAERDREKDAAGKQADPKRTLTKEEERLFQAAKKGKVDLLSSLLENLDINLNVLDERGWTLLHVAANDGNDEVVAKLLEKGADPTVMVNGIKSKTPYNYSKTKEVRNAFRRLMAREPTKWDYALAQVPSPLTEAMEKAEREKEIQQEKEKKKRDKKKNKQKQKQKNSDSDDSDSDSEKEEKKSAPQGSQKVQPGIPRAQGPKVQQGSSELERERRARAAEQRLTQQQQAQGITPTGPACAFCKRSLTGLVPFERLEFKYCSTKCVADHRKQINQ